MTDITVGQVSGAINFAILIGLYSLHLTIPDDYVPRTDPTESEAQITFPLLLVFVLAGVLNKGNTAATWSVVCRFVHATFWPTILSADSTNFHNVNGWVTALRIFSALGLVFLAIAGVVTPLGLSEQIAGKHSRVRPFEYVRDDGPFGVGIPERDEYGFTRLCGAFSMPCPGQSWPPGRTANGTNTRGPNLDVTAEIPAGIFDIWQSATSENTTVAGLFDIQYRSYQVQSEMLLNGTDKRINKGLPFTRG